MLPTCTWNYVLNILPGIECYGKECFMYNEARLWNGLPFSIRSIENKDSLIKTLAFFT